VKDLIVKAFAQTLVVLSTPITSYFNVNLECDPTPLVDVHHLFACAVCVLMPVSFTIDPALCGIDLAGNYG